MVNLAGDQQLHEIYIHYRKVEVDAHFVISGPLHAWKHWSPFYRVPVHFPVFRVTSGHQWSPGHRTGCCSRYLTGSK